MKENKIFSGRMKNKIIKDIYAVWMHHWDSKNLPIDDVLYVQNEPENPFDETAVAIFRDKQTNTRCAYLQKKYAKFISVLLKEHLMLGVVYLKAKDLPTKFSVYSGPKQRCNLGFKTDDKNVFRIREVCQGRGVELVIY